MERGREGYTRMTNSKANHMMRPLEFFGGTADTARSTMGFRKSNMDWHATDISNLIHSLHKQREHLFYLII